MFHTLIDPEWRTASEPPAATGPRRPLRRPARWKLSRTAWVALACAVAWGTAQAQTVMPPTPVAPSAPSGDMGRVVQTIPVLQQVPVQRQVCNDEAVSVPGQKSGAGAVMGGIAGGAIGNQIGDGGGRAVATLLGVLGGAVLGDRIEGGAPPSTQWVQRCSTQTVYETRPVAYNVTYEYAGKQYTVQMPQDPGAWVPLQITPVLPPGYRAPHSEAPIGSMPQVIGGVNGIVTAPTTVITQETTYLTPSGAYTVAGSPWAVDRPWVRPSLWVEVSGGSRYSHRPHRSPHHGSHRIHGDWR